MLDFGVFNELPAIGIPAHDSPNWHCHFRLDKYDLPLTSADILTGRFKPFDVIEDTGNLLMTLGATDLWTALIGGSITVFSNANAYIGVGDSSTAASAGQTNLQASSNKTRVAMDSTYPSVSTNTCVFRSTFGSGVAEWGTGWQEWGVFNDTSAGHMLNRKVQNLGTKGASTTWQFTVTLSLA